MSRELTTATKDALQAPIVHPCFLVELDFSSGMVRVWTGYGDIVAFGNTFTGVGDLGAISSIDESSDIASKGINLTLSGIPPEAIALALLDNFQGRAAKIYLGALNATTGQLIADPYRMFGGRMDTMGIQEGGETAAVSISVENRLVDLKRSRERRYTTQDQQIDYPGDLFFSFVPTLQNRPIRWGIPYSVAAAETPATPPINSSYRYR